MVQYYKVDSERQVTIEKVDVTDVSLSKKRITVKDSGGLGFMKQEVGKDGDNHGGYKYFKTIVEACEYLIELEKMKENTHWL